MWPWRKPISPPPRTYIAPWPQVTRENLLQIAHALMSRRTIVLLWRWHINYLRSSTIWSIFTPSIRKKQRVVWCAQLWSRDWVALVSARDIAAESSPILLLWFLFFYTIELMSFLHWSLLLAAPIFSLVTPWWGGVICLCVNFIG